MPTTRHGAQRLLLLVFTVVGLTVACWLALTGVANAAGPDVLTDTDPSQKGGGAVAGATGAVNEAAEALPEPASDVAASAQAERAAPDGPAPSAPDDPATDAAPAPVTDTADDMADVADPVIEAVEDAVAPVTEPVEETVEDVVDAAAPVTEPVEETVEDVVDAAAPVTDPVEETVTSVIETVEESTAPVTDAVAPVTGIADDAVGDVLDADADQYPSPPDGGVSRGDRASGVRVLSGSGAAMVQGVTARADALSGSAASSNAEVTSPTERFAASAGVPSLTSTGRGTSGVASVVVTGAATSTVPGAGPRSGGAGGEGGPPFVAVEQGRIVGPAADSSVSIASDGAMVAIVPIPFWGEPG